MEIRPPERLIPPLASSSSATLALAVVMAFVGSAVARLPVWLSIAAAVLVAVGWLVYRVGVVWRQRERYRQAGIEQLRQEIREDREAITTLAGGVQALAKRVAELENRPRGVERRRQRSELARTLGDLRAQDAPFTSDLLTKEM